MGNAQFTQQLAKDNNLTEQEINEFFMSDPDIIEKEEMMHLGNMKIPNKQKNSYLKRRIQQLIS